METAKTNTVVASETPMVRGIRSKRMVLTGLFHWKERPKSPYTIMFLIHR